MTGAAHDIHRLDSHDIHRLDPALMLKFDEK